MGRARPVTLTVAAVAQAAEGLLVLGAGGYVAVRTVTGHPTSLATAVVLAGLGIVAGGLLLVVAAALFRMRTWGRTPGVLTQIFTGVVAIYMIQSGQYGIGVPLVVVAAVGLAALLSPPTTHALYGD